MPSDLPGFPSPPPPPQGPPPPPPFVPPGYPPPLEPGLSGSSDETPPPLDGVARRTSVLTLAINLGGVVITFFLLLPQLLVPSDPSTDTGSEPSGPVILILFVAFAGLFAVANSIGWFARTYTMNERELVIDEGVFQRRKKVVPYARVQQVDLKQQLVAQVLNVAQLRIDTAGESSASVKLGLLDVKLARGMRRYILQRRSVLQSGPTTTPATAAFGATGTQLPPPPPAPEVTLLHLGVGRLILAALTHHTIVVGVPVLLVLGLWGAAFATANDGATTGAAVGGTVAVLFVASLLFLATIVGSSVINQYGFTLGEQGDDLHLRYGLLQVQHISVPRRRVQHVTIEDNPIRRALGIVAVQLHSAAPLHAGKDAATRFEVPVMDRRELDGFLHALMGGDWHVPPLTPRSSAARRRGITRRVVLLALVMVPPALVAPPLSLLFLLAAALGVPWGLAAHRRAGFAETPQLLVLAHGVLQHHVDLLPFSRVQSCATDQSPFQRWSNVRTLHVNVAGPSADPHLYDMPDDDAIAYAREVPRRSAR